MRIVTLLILAFLCAPFALAQAPEVKTFYGDLNQDGVKDKVVIETPQNKAKMKKRDDGYVYNFNQPVLCIYFGNAGSYKLFKKYPAVLPCPESENECIDMDVTISNKGVLSLSYDLFYSMGGWGDGKHSYQFRYQNGDFYMIGEDHETCARNTGEFEHVSTNYLSHKKQTVTGNAFNKKAKQREKWTAIPNKPLEKLGSRNLKYDE